MLPVFLSAKDDTGTIVIAFAAHLNSHSPRPSSGCFGRYPVTADDPVPPCWPISGPSTNYRLHRLWPLPVENTDHFARR